MWRASDAPPNAAAVAPITVMPIWTVARNCSGASRSRFTARADERPSSTSCASRVFLSAMTAISAPEKTPFARTSATTMASSTRISFRTWPPRVVYHAIVSPAGVPPAVPPGRGLARGAPRP